MTKFKQVEFSRRTARRNPKMILREYDRLIDEQEQKKQRLAKAIDKVTIDARVLFENSDMEFGAKKMINELRTLFDIKFEADRGHHPLCTHHTLVDVYVPALEAMLNAVNEKTVNANHVAYRESIRKLKLLKEEREEFFINICDFKVKIMELTVNSVIEFAMYLTGHDRETIEQMYEDWLHPKGYNEFCLP